MRWDIFCQIVDNYGDAGVCWRLARALSRLSSSSINTVSSAECDDSRIRLFCDDLNVLNVIAHGDAVAHGASLGIEVLPWSAAESPSVLASVGDVVIEAFACHLPKPYIDAMVQKASDQAPIWINLEYLTAEAWADDMHLMPSPQNNGLNKYFYFPGFTPKTGGVLLGDWYEVTSNLLTSGRVTSPPNSLSLVLQSCRPASKKISVFNYKQAPLDAWLNSVNQAALAHGDQVDVFLCADQNVSTATQKAFSLEDSAVKLIQLPFIPQEDYDYLLSVCDMNLVRGEDSFVRAQWAGKPFIWDIYPQSDLAHEVKLNAFLDRYFESSIAELRSTGVAAMKWGPASDWWPHLGALTKHSEAWRDNLMGLGHLEGKILDFVKSQEISR
ncbi:elongation factor P maturation arginine rhamnosyltransferase EarP [Polynucleobacter sp. AM-26B4]|uniref:elongation factor P maturation arginine rhamnosyltransferase EarP n=1 Tax=Polynucleobacter sp. AM-26B4 TaxID=2689103 RepID=UPI001C0C3B63|nr:elongation factor P maturation arginine rhamnosyltransferase EarP [Polynucleobacter sp. AM-26B4]MBU3584864.1 elongation factor P maturation arginine rhamnosyltransferase EarP [Polynucleobacter sp. AM-26B4]